MSKREFKGEQGYITFALGAEYIRLAYVQAMSIKLTQEINNYAVIVDKNNEDEARKYSNVFDQIIVIDYNPQVWDMSQHWRVFPLTPWRETVLLDADIIFPTSIDHWWPALRQRDVCLTNHVRDFREDRITTRRYRKLFDENLLPDVYGGFIYFRYSQFSVEFFALIKVITDNWEWIAKEHLIKNEDLKIRIDEMFAIATRIMGSQHVTLPISIPTFVHGKGGAWELSEQQSWYEQLYTEWNDNAPIVGHYQQRLPFHYHHKEWITNDIVGQYERNYEKFINSHK